jgi:hypothetical protein
MENSILSNFYQKIHKRRLENCDGCYWDSPSLRRHTCYDIVEFWEKKLVLDNLLRNKEITNEEYKLIYEDIKDGSEND